MDLKVLLVNAPAEHIKERHYEQPDIPRIALAYLASYLLCSDIDCVAVDAKYEKRDLDRVLDVIRENNPDIVGLTAMTPEIMDAGRLAREVKKNYPRVVTVIGGPHATALPEQTLKEFAFFDIACFGEGEYTLRDIVKAVRTGRPLEEIDGIAYRDSSGAIRVNRPRPFAEDLDKLPPPAWHLFPPAKRYPILGSRGCPFRCNFCMRVLGGRIRYRDPDLVVKEMCDIYEKFRPQVFEFDDETFGIDKKKTYRLLDRIIENGLHKKVKWNIQTRVDVVTEELLIKMKEAGCEWVGFGIESGNEGILKMTQKNVTKEKARNAIAMAKKARLSTGSFFILGHPFETEATIKDTIDFALELNTTTVSFGIMMPYPGTEIAKMAEESKGGYKLLSKNWQDYNKQTNDVLELKNVSGAELQKYQLIGYLKFYFLRFSLRKFKGLLEFIDLRSLIFVFLQRVLGLGR
ncbi:MAG: hypothetical protein A2Z72_05440 [Omnitrophica bacterium RBG_13_46_9]|nr:MAG: hypothetical protein A2Z72_05440 [Omnitrophica bacterium RBG_13_46_9]